MRTPLDDALSGGGREAAPACSGRDAAACVAVLAAALALEWASPVWGQVAAGFVLWAFLLRRLARASGLERRTFFAILAWATAGELFCSLAWGLYTYRLGNIPHAVPPAHVIVFLIGLALSRFATPASADRLTAAYAVLTVGAAWLLGDELSVFLFAVYLLAYRLRPGLRPLLATMFLVTLALELTGIALGTWYWEPVAPVLGLATTNPPVAVAAFYCVLDVLVFATVRGRLQRFVARGLRLSIR